MVDKQNLDGTWSEAESIPYYPNIFEKNSFMDKKSTALNDDLT